MIVLACLWLERVGCRLEDVREMSRLISNVLGGCGSGNDAAVSVSGEKGRCAMCPCAQVSLAMCHNLLRYFRS